MGHYYPLLQRMFTEMVLEKDADRIADFYHPEFRMETNQIEQGFAEFLADHRKYYSDENQMNYEIEYDDGTVVEDSDGLACRVWITTQQGDEEPTRIEVLLIAKYRDDKIWRLWELTLPNWSSLAAFEEP